MRAKLEGRVRRRGAGAAMLAAVLVASLPASGTADTPDDDGAELITVSGKPGAIAPAFALDGPDGTTVRLEDLRGDVVYVDFWASWCPPCLQSFPWMNAVAERFRAEGLRVVAINLDGDREAAERFLADVRADFDVAFDPDGTSAEAYGLLGMPSSYVVGRDGRVTFAHVGFRRKDAPELEAAIERALAPPLVAALPRDGEERGR